MLDNADADAKAAVAESSQLVAELIRLIGPVDEKGSLDKKAMGTGLSCLATISGLRRAARAEAAVAVLWAVCHKYKDRRAADAAAASEGGLTRLLLLLQSGCSPPARQMAVELLKIYKVNAKSCLAGYDSKTTHIMPF